MSQGRPSVDDTLIRIRERSFLDILDLSLLVIRRHPLALGVASAVGIVPFAVLNAILLDDPEASAGLLIPLLYMEAPWATLPLTVVLGGLMFGKAPRPREVLGRLARSLPAVVLVHGLVRGFLGITFLLIPLVPGRLWFVSEVILLERAGPFRAIGRCGRLCTQRSGDFVLEAIGQLFFGIVFAVCFWVGTGAVTSALFRSELTWQEPEESSVMGLRFQLGLWVAIAFFAVARFLNYLDQRIRLEGWELRLRLLAVGRELEKEGP